MGQFGVLFFLLPSFNVFRVQLSKRHRLHCPIESSELALIFGFLPFGSRRCPCLRDKSPERIISIWEQFFLCSVCRGGLPNFDFFEKLVLELVE
jgi:hypothetical protein